MILDAAIALFQEEGFSAVGIDDIGAAAGITGPAVYRHFKTKHHILVAAYDRVWERMEGDLRAVLERSDEAQETLAALLDSYIGVALDDRALIAVYAREELSLPEADRRSLRRRQRLYIEEWVHVLEQVRPELSDGEARAAVQAAIGLINSVAFYDSGIDDTRLHALLRAMAGAALAAESQPAHDPAGPAR